VRGPEGADDSTSILAKQISLTQLTTGVEGELIAWTLRPGIFPPDVAAERYSGSHRLAPRLPRLRVDEAQIVPGDLHMPHEHLILIEQRGIGS
jgi:hypothetical protein